MTAFSLSGIGANNFCAITFEANLQVNRRRLRLWYLFRQERCRRSHVSHQAANIKCHVAVLWSWLDETRHRPFLSTVLCVLFLMLLHWFLTLTISPVVNPRSGLSPSAIVGLPFAAFKYYAYLYIITNAPTFKTDPQRIATRRGLGFTVSCSRFYGQL